MTKATKYMKILGRTTAMELIPIRTRVLHPPKDNLLEVLDTSLTDVRDGDVIIITSKVVAIHEGRCVPIEGTDKESLVKREAEYVYQSERQKKPLTITNDALISASGIDESNGEGYYILLPEDSYVSARVIRTHLMERHSVTRLGVIITDSHSLPFRYGAMSVSIGCWGFEPIESHIGRTDIFGRVMQYSKTNLPDSIAAAATLVSGECDEVQPIQIARGVPNLTWTDNDPRPSFIIPRDEDIYRDLYKDFRKGGATD
jgi:dihydrofolate synthase / folylpolyglutamate synthase